MTSLLVSVCVITQAFCALCNLVGLVQYSQPKILSQTLSAVLYNDERGWHSRPYTVVWCVSKPLHTTVQLRTQYLLQAQAHTQTHLTHIHIAIHNVRIDNIALIYKVAMHEYQDTHNST